ncbi:unnamed protein product [Thlaspi arvense]|uniref:S-acyltransferase n=1 Tax=Thlaspi arvense TaxID=13288 RepID=A0AAU9SHA5_THLAR|nr:unnamed protein product [Thlaspi arvense]
MSSQNHERKRIYQVWPGKNKFICGGRIVFGPDASSLLLTTCMIGAPAITFCIRIACLITDRHPLFHSLVLFGAILLTILDFTFLYLTSTRDPGIIPRNKEAPVSETPEVVTQSLEWVSDKVGNAKLPRTRDVTVNGFTVKVKFCDTCKLYRPPRASHCSICNNCVQRFDHHCPWVGQCIALRNYPFFVCFLSCSTLLCLYVFAFSLISMLEVHGEFYLVLADDVILGVLALYCFVSVWFVGGLTVFHFYLICTNQANDLEKPDHDNLDLRLQELDYGNNSDATAKKISVDEAMKALQRLALFTSDFMEKLERGYEINIGQRPDKTAMAWNETKLKRLYQVWRGSNKFLCGGRLIFGPDASSLYLSTILIFGPAVMFFVKMYMKMADPRTKNPIHCIPILCVSWILTLLDIFFLFMTSGRDPGIVPRSLRPPESDDAPDSTTPSMEWVSGRTPNIRLPRVKDVTVNGHTVKVKFCDTCLLYRPPRASHCSICNNCVQRFDHHCPWVGQCIGLTTYENFRYRYDKKENPYNKGVLGNIWEIFLSKIPPSMNKFRSFVKEEDYMMVETPTSNFGESLVSSKEKIDIEMGGGRIVDESGKSYSLPEILRNLNYEDLEDDCEEDDLKAKDHHHHTHHQHHNEGIISPFDPFLTNEDSCYKDGRKGEESGGSSSDDDNEDHGDAGKRVRVSIDDQEKVEGYERNWNTDKGMNINAGSEDGTSSPQSTSPMLRK